MLIANAGFAPAVPDAGLIWIGPPPRAIRDLGDKVAARHIAQRAGAPLVAGTPDPVSVAEEVVAMKMEQPLNTHKSGTIKGPSAEVGASLTSQGPQPSAGRSRAGCCAR